MPCRFLTSCLCVSGLILSSVAGCTGPSAPSAPPVAVTTPIPSPSAPTPIQFGSVRATLPLPPKPAPRPKGPVPPAYTYRSSVAPAIDSVLEIKVAIAEASSLTLGTSTAGRAFTSQGKVLKQLTPQQGYTATASGDTILLGDVQMPSGTWIQADQGGTVALGDRAYRGRLLLLASGGQLLAVNYVLLQDYLVSVVGSEVSPDWPQEALKAQALAARSYALTYYFKPATAAYHLGDTEAYQVYSGIGREAATVRQAVLATGGEFISYRGGIVESLYAASDDLVAVAHGGRGMSQLGALRLAQQGQSYKQILATYYPGTGIARIALDQD